MHNDIQNIINLIEQARRNKILNNESARAATIVLGFEGHDALLANRLLAQGSDPASLEYAFYGKISDSIMTAHRFGPGSLEGEYRDYWLLLAALSTDESKDSSFLARIQQFCDAYARMKFKGLDVNSESNRRLIDEKRKEIDELDYVTLPVGGVFMRLYAADLGFAAAYWAGEECAAVLGSFNGEPYVAVGSKRTPLADLGVKVDKVLSPTFGIIEDKERVKFLKGVWDGNYVDVNGRGQWKS